MQFQQVLQDHRHVTGLSMDMDKQMIINARAQNMPYTTWRQSICCHQAAYLPSPLTYQAALGQAV